MAESARFNIGFLKTSSLTESMFLSVTPGFEHGPGILRDGITPPRMPDPHSIPFVCNAKGISHCDNLPMTTNPWLQRAGTWTIYHHVKRFIEHHGDDWTILGVQSCGDLTMNPWHIAYIGTSHLRQDGMLCALLTEIGPDPKKYLEPVQSRIYRCMVKWNSSLKPPPKLPIQALDLTFERISSGYAVKINDPASYEALKSWLEEQREYSVDKKDIAPLIEFALSGKSIVEHANALSLSNAIDRFQDIRHVFNLPTVPAAGSFGGQPVPAVNFGEYQLFGNLNERRAALSSAVIIDLAIGDHVKIEWDDLTKVLLERHYKEINDSPTRRGFFRKYRDELARDKVEIFFPHNVYPFGVLGSHEDIMVCLASGGLSGRVGNTLEGITRIMFDFFGCADAMVLDEGYDTFQIVNPSIALNAYTYTNEEMLAKILSFTKKTVDEEHRQSAKTTPAHMTDGLKEWPLNEKIMKEMDDDHRKMEEDHSKNAIGSLDYSDVMSVCPHRSQMRSVLIFASRNKTKTLSNAK